MDAARQVIKAAEARAAALADADAERLSGLLHEEFRWTAHVGATYSRQEYVRRNTEGHTVWRSQDLSSADVVVVGDTAVLYAEATDVVLLLSVSLLHRWSAWSPCGACRTQVT